MSAKDGRMSLMFPIEEYMQIHLLAEAEGLRPATWVSAQIRKILKRMEEEHEKPENNAT